MKLLIVGASGGTGRELVKQALEQGHHVTAFVRNTAQFSLSHERLRIEQGNVLDFDSVERAVRGKDAVLSALGHTRWIIPNRILSEGTHNILRAMAQRKVRRFVCETSLGVADSWWRLGLYYTLFVIPVIVLFYFIDKARQERLIKQSDLDWVIVRPGRLTNGKKREIYWHGFDVGNALWTVSISRSDVADFMLRQLTEDTYLRKTPGVAY
jgi:putative NADH-flavin reductase